MDTDASVPTVTSEVFRQALPVFVRDFNACDSLIMHLESRQKPLINDTDRQDLSACRSNKRDYITKLFSILRAIPGSEDVVIEFLKGPQRSTQPHLIKLLQDLKNGETENRGQLPDPVKKDSEHATSQPISDLTGDTSTNLQEDYRITKDKVIPLVDLITNDEVAIREWVNILNRLELRPLTKAKVEDIKDKEQAIRETLLLYVREKTDPPLQNFLQVLTACGLNSLAGEIRSSEIWT